MLQFNHESMKPMYVSEEFDSNDILNDISNIENIERKKTEFKTISYKKFCK